MGLRLIEVFEDKHVSRSVNTQQCNWTYQIDSYYWGDWPMKGFDPERQMLSSLHDRRCIIQARRTQHFALRAIAAYASLGW